MSVLAKSKKGSRDGYSEGKAAFERVKDQVAYCGLLCSTCSIGNGTVNVLAGNLRKTLTDYGFKHYGPKEIDYDALLKGLEVLRSTSHCKGCLKGGGNATCSARACASQKGLSECVECGSEKRCKNAGFIRHMRRGARRVGMKVKDGKEDLSKVSPRWLTLYE